MPTVRDALNRLKWDLHRLDDATLTYIHRGAPGDVRSVGGAHIRDIGRSFLEFDDARIPFHRILVIELDGQPFWERTPGPNPAPEE